MEKEPHNSDDDHDRDIPELERLWLGEIDMTGVVRQDDALVDVIGDAIGEAEDGELPEWGARTMARALANERDDPHSGALHHFAVTGRVDPEAIARELADLYERVNDEEIREWINWLGTYVIKLGDDESQAEPTKPPRSLEAKHRQQPEGADTHDRVTGRGNESTQEDQPAQNDALADERASTRGPAAQFTEHLNRLVAEADAHGETIAPEDAQATAAMLASFLVVMDVKDSAMMHLAESGEVDQLKLYDECQQLKAVAWKIRDVHIWVEHLEQYLGRRISGDNQQVTHGLREHGDAFRAYLQLPDVDPKRPDLLNSFQDAYIGSYTSMHELLDELTDVTKGLAAATKAAEAWGLEEFATLNEAALIEVARSTWDIVEYQSRLHVFMK